MRNSIYFLALIPILIAFTGCGGGSSATSTTNNTSTTILGISSDGYISDAKVCMDSNLNGLCDAEEKITSSDKNGLFSFTDVAEDLMSIISSQGEDRSLDKPFSGDLKRVLEVDKTQNPNNFSTTPLTDLVATKFLNSNDKTIENLYAIESEFAASLGISVENLNSDPMKNRDIFILSQKIQQIKILTESTGESLDKITKSLADRIIISKSINIDISALYADMGSNVDSKKIDYIQQYMDNLKAKISSISADTTLLGRYQMLIDDATYQATIKLSNNDLTSQITIDLSDSRVSSSFPKVINPIKDIFINANSTQKTVDLQNVFSDDDNDDADITKIVLSNSNSSLVQASISGNTLTLNFNPSAQGYSDIVIRATSGGLSVNCPFRVGNIDSDNDFIPDDIESYLGMDSNNSDQDSDGVVDGLESSTNSISDQFFDKEWHIRSLGTEVNPNPSSLTIKGNDLGLIDIYHTYMGYNSGDPIVVQVVDTGVEADHEDLVQNMDLTLSRNSNTGTMGDPVESGIHGTMCAGIIAARAFNGKGVRGVAPFAKIAGNNWLGSSQTVSELEEVWTKNDPQGKIAISSNSWGIKSADNDTFYEEFMKYASENLRIIDGIARGKIFVKAAGNSREDRHDSGLEYSNSNPYVIVVAGLKNDNTYASYSSPGSSIFISGYCGDYYNNSATIATTSVEGNTSVPTWAEDTNHNYTYAMNGTSAATPMISGSLALVLEACPTLGWRDLKYLLAKDAIQVDATNSSWHTNSAGFHHSVDYGFGLIDTGKMINDCQNSYTPLPQSSTFSQTFDSIDIKIPDNDARGISYTFNITEDKIIEWLGVTVYSDHAYGGDLEIYLTSPSGTKTRLMLGNNSGKDYSLANGFRYGSVAFFGERSLGNWTLQIADIALDDTGSLQKINFEVFGH